MKDLITYIEESNVLQIGDTKYACPNTNFIVDGEKGISIMKIQKSSISVR